ncbi:hypothetical protein [Burkholderia cepacia]|uniref:hypothetical protein n=1 Tax=Burkholderia cepacia TaxID=292 RepID=UPI0006687CD1|nr:hypothetical protein [Burkholderia cepacia]
MFHTIGYKGHFIQVSTHNGTETIETQIVGKGGSFVLERRKTFAGAQRAITKHLQSRITAEQNA